MIGMKNIQEVVSAEELDILNVLEDSLQQEELELRQLQSRLMDALQLVDRLLEAGYTDLEAAGAEAELAIAGVATTTTVPESVPVITITEEVPTEVPAAKSDAEILQERIRQRAAEIYIERGCEEGHTEEHWLQAEAEIMGTMPVAAPAEEIQAEAPTAITETETQEERIRRRAAEIYIERGCEEGHTEEHWLQAEAEVMGTMPLAAPAEEVKVEVAVAETETLEDRIRRRATEIYVERGCEEGHTEEHWLQAEAEILGQPVHETSTQDRRHGERRKSGVRSANRRVACIGSPNGEERRSGEDRRRSERRMGERRAAAAAAGTT